MFVALVLGTFMYFLPTPSGLSLEGYRTIIIVAAVPILIVFEPLPLPAVAMLVLIFQVVFGIASPDRVASSFMSDAVFFIMGSLMLAVAVIQQGLDKRLALGIIRLSGHRTWKIVLGFMTVCAVLSSFMGPHTVTALMMPAGLTLIRFTSKDPKKVSGLTALILFSIAYGSIIGSLGTPSGGGRNAIMLDYLARFGIGEITYLSWMAYTYPMLLVEVPLALGLLWWTFRPELKILDSAVRRLTVQVVRGGAMTGRQVAAVGILVLIFLGWVFLSPRIGLGIVALIGVALYLSLGLVEWNELNRRTNWGVILLFGAAISLGIQVKETGAASWLAGRIIDGLSWMTSDVGFLSTVVSVLLPASLANILGSAPTVAVIGPIVLNMGGDPMVLGIAAALASAFGYLTAAASPSGMIIYSSGLVNSRDFLRGGWKLFALSVVLLGILSQVWWPFLR